MNSESLVFPKTLEKVIFAVLSVNGFVFSSAFLTGVGIKAARRIGESINQNEEIDGGIKVFSSTTVMFSAFASVLISHLDESKLLDLITPYSTIGAEVMLHLIQGSEEGEIARQDFLRDLIAPTSFIIGDPKCLVIVVSESQSFLLPQTFCKMTGISYEDNNSAPGALNYDYVTMHIAEKRMSYGLIDESVL